MDAVDADLMQQARAVDPVELGQRVRAARFGCGMTQAAVAGAEMSTAYVSRIESGQRRPDPGLLDVIAGRLGVGVEVLLFGASRHQIAEQRAALAGAEMALRTGHAAAALDDVDVLLIDLTPGSDLHVEALRLRAEALEATGALDDAILLLEDVLADAAHDAHWLDLTATLCRCYLATGSLIRAIETGDRGVRIARHLGLAGTFAATRLSVALVAAHLENADTGEATRLSRRAVEESERLDSPDALAVAYWNASVVESRLGHSSSAADLAGRALVLSELGDDERQRATLRTQVGACELRSPSPDPQTALQHLRRAEAELEATDAAPGIRSINRLSQARAHFLMGQNQQALLAIDRCLAISADTSPVVTAETQMLAGQIVTADGRPDEGLDLYRLAARTLADLGSDRAAARALFELGALFEDASLLPEAVRAYRRAGTAGGLSTTEVGQSVRPQGSRLGDSARAERPDTEPSGPG